MLSFFHTKTKRNTQLRFASIFILLLALLTRIPLLSGSLWLDEAAQALESARPLTQQLQIATDFQPPLFHLVVHLMTYLSLAEWWLRLPSLIAGLTTIIFTYLIVQKYFQKSTALLTALLLTTSSFHIFYSQELRPYALSAAFATISWWFLLNYLHPSQSWLQKLIRWKLPFERAEHFYGFMLLTIAGLYTMYLYPFCLAGQLCYWVMQTGKKDLKNLIFCVSLLFFAFLPWLPSFIEQFQVSSALRASTPEWEFVVSTPQIKALPLVLGKFLFGILNLELNMQFIFLTLLVVLPLIGVALYTYDETKESWKIVLSWLIIPIVLAWLVSFVVPVIQAKRVLFALPGWYLLISMLVVAGTRYKDTAVRSITMLSFVTLIGIQIWSMSAYYFHPAYQREDWRTLIETIDQKFDAKHTAIIFGFNHPFSPWEWYDHQAFPILLTGTTTTTSLAQLNQPLLSATQFDTILVFDYLRDLTDPHRYIDTWLVQNNYRQVEVIDTPSIGFVRVYKRGDSVATKHY